MVFIAIIVMIILDMLLFFHTRDLKISTYVAMVIGCDNEKDIMEKVWPYFLENESSYTYHYVTDEEQP